MTLELRKHMTPRKKISSTIAHPMPSSSCSPPRRPSSPHAVPSSPHPRRSQQQTAAGSSSCGETKLEGETAHKVANYYYPVTTWHTVLAALTWFTMTAVILWCHVLPASTEWWTTTTPYEKQPPPQTLVETSIGATTTTTTNSSNDDNYVHAIIHLEELAGNYQYASLEEMNDRHLRFPTIDERVRVYMSNWYTPPCSPQQQAKRGGGVDPITAAAHDENANVNHATNVIDSSYIQYNYLPDSSGEGRPPLLILQELVIPEEKMMSGDDASDDDDNKNDGTAVDDDDNDNDGLMMQPTEEVSRSSEYSHSSSNHRTFLLDSRAVEKGSRIFFLTADELRRCDSSSCLDMVHFVFPSLHRVNMAVVATTATAVGATTTTTTLFATTDIRGSGYAGNALDAVDGNRNGVVPIVLQFGDLEVSRAFVPSTHRNETYPATPLFRKFRASLTAAELERVVAGATCYQNAEREVPMTSLGERRLQPIITKLTYQRHFGMLDEIPVADIPWTDKKDGAIWRGALTGMKRNGFRVVQSATAASTNNINNKLEMCMSMQRCKLVYTHAASALVNASLVGVVAYHSHNMLSEPVVPEVLQGVRLYGPRVSYHEILQYKAIIMLEGNDISSGLKWALYSNSVVLAQKPTYTSWAMEELLEPWVHYIPLADDLSDVEERVQWVLDHDEKAQQIARAGSLWISDLVYHPDVAADEAEIFDETFRRYKQHFVHNPALSYDRLVYHRDEQ